jgi:hypothetical protein
MNKKMKVVCHDGSVYSGIRSIEVSKNVYGKTFVRLTNNDVDITLDINKIFCILKEE